MHSEQLAEHGGSDGMRDETLPDSALAKPHNVFAYEEDPDIFRLAASYAFGIARNHAFIDGNKRPLSSLSPFTFLDRNRWDIMAAKEQVYLTFLHLAEGTLRRAQPRRLVPKHAVPLEK